MPWRAIDTENLVRFLRETSAATWIADGSGYVIDATEWMELTGQTAEEAAGEGWTRAVHPDDVDRVSAAWQTAVSHAAHFNTDYRILCADAQYRWFNVRGTPVMGDDGNARQWVGVILAIPGQSRPSRSKSPDEAQSADRFDDISPAALRAARAMLGWSAEELADAAGLARTTLRRLEDNSASTSRRTSIAKIIKVLSGQNLQCIGRDGTILGVVDSAADPDESAELTEQDA